MMENEIYKELDAPLNELSESIAVYLSSEGIREISSADLDIIIRKSAYSLPTRPSDAGMSPEQIKAAFFRPFTDAERSLASEINRVAREADGKSNNLAELVGRIKDILVSVIAENKEWAQQLYSDNEDFKKTLEKELKSYLKRIDGEAGVEYAYAQKDGVGALKPMSAVPKAGSIALRGEGGRLKASSPVEDDDVVTKGYADKTHYGASQIFASALKGSASGEAVALKDVSPIEHNLGVRVESKNLIPYPYEKTTKVENGITFTDNGDGTVTANGTATDRATFDVLANVDFPNGEYIFSGCPAVGSTSTYAINCYFKDNNNQYFVDALENGDGKIVIATNGFKSLGFQLRIYPGFKAENLVFKPMLERGTAKTTHAPYIADTSGVKLLVQGKNLFDVSKILTSSTVINNGDGTILVKDNGGQATNRTFKELCPELKAGDTFTLSLRTTNAVMDSKVGGYIYIAGSYNKILNSGSTYTATQEMLDGDVLLYKAHYSYQEQVEEGIVSEIQVEIGTTATEYEPYKEPIEYAQGEDIKSIAPCTTIMTDTAGTVLTVEYNRDLNKAFEELMNLILSLGGNVYD